MKCLRCQQENPPRAKFCLECGASLAQFCRRCGTALPPDATFCPQCAQPVAAAEPSELFASPDAYTPRHLAERILTSRGALEGERKQVTVLFADVKGSLELLAGGDPEEARRLLDAVLERMMEAVHHYEGTVNQVMGDGIMALFGAPLALEDHAIRACYAALRMQEAIARYAAELRASEGRDVRIRVGLSSGEVVVRSIGSDLHMDYTAVGQTTHMAARMEQLAEPGTILMAAGTLRLAEGSVDVKPHGLVPVKGLAEPVEVVELVGAGPARSRFQAGLARGLTRFVGRGKELEQLRQALERARAGHGQVVALVGEPGVGKSRIAWEFVHSQSGWLVLESTSLSYGRATAYLPVVELLRSYFRIESRDDALKIREKVTGRLRALDRALESYLPAFLWLLAAPVDDDTWHRLDPPQRRQRTQDGVTRLFLRESLAEPVLVVFEDLHWIDGATQAMLDSLVESLPTARLLLLVTYRPEYRHGWGGQTNFRRIGLDALAPESAGELLTALLGTDATLEPLKRLLIERTEGNPFFLEETVRELVETGVLAGERGAWRLAKPLVSLEIPATATAILAARIDRLAPEDKRLLQAATVIGHDVPFTLLQAIADEDGDRIRQGLARLQAAEFLDETRLFPDLEYRFRHALTHAVAYASVLHDRRRRLHARIVAALEALAAEGPQEQVERLAHHALRGELWEKALVYARQAGRKAFAASANREAVACFEQALRALDHLPRSADTLEQALDVRLDVRNALHPLGEFRRISELLEQAEALADEIGDRRRGGRVAAFKTQYFWWSGDYAAAIESGERALRLADEAADLAGQVLANYFLGNVYHALGEYARAMELLGRCVDRLTGDLLHERFGVPGHPAVLCRFYLSLCLAERGEFAEGLARAEEARRIAEEVENPFSLTQAYFALGFLSFRRGDLEAAIPPLERALSECQHWQIPIWFPRVASCLGSAYATAGRLEEGVRLLEEAMAAAEARGLLVRHVLSIVWLGEAYLRAGRVDQALARARQALALAEQHREQGHAAWALRLLAEIAARHPQSGLGAADEQYARTRARAESLGMRPLLAHCHLGLASLHREGGDRLRAKEHLTAASALYREMDMPLGLAESRAERDRLG